MALVKDEIYEVLIDSMDKDGKGVSHINGTIVFVNDALEGELVKIKIIKTLANCAFADTIEIIKASPNRETPLCKYYSLCGGCDMMHMNYDLEAKVKENKVINALKHIAKISNPNVREIIKADHLTHYRNKAIIPFQLRDGKIVAGMYKKKTHEIIDIDTCLIEPKKLEEILKIVKAYLKAKRVTIYDENTHKGIFRALMLRKTKYDDLMLVFIVKEDIDLTDLVGKLDNFNIKSFYLCINDKQTNVMLTDNLKHISKDKVIVEDILGLKFNASPLTFLQVNNKQTEKLYSKAIEYLEPNLNMKVIDAYCGMGSITLNVAKYVKEVYGIEVVPSAISDANINKELNGINNAYFSCGKCEDLILDLVNKKEFDAIIFDPPRKGCDKHFLDVIKQSKIKRIVYVSCNIATCARDILYLSDTYKFVEATPVDLFPRSLHVETVCVLSLKDIHK